MNFNSNITRRNWMKRSRNVIKNGEYDVQYDDVIIKILPHFRDVVMTVIIITRPWGYKTWVQSQSQNKAQ